jgi:WD40 repeat protein
MKSFPPLGAGGMGEVYRARDPQLGRDVAIKILPSFLSRDPERLRRFEQEARAAAALNHPNILAVYQMGMHDGAPYLVSELLEGSTLSRPPAPVRLTNGPISYGSFAASRDGKQIFAAGAQRRGELLRYDPKTHDFLPYLGGISASDPTFSRDGKWMAYMSYPEHTLWRSRLDGSDRLQLTYSPVVVVFPRISPDGTKVAFSDDQGVVYVVSMNGGTLQKFTEVAAAPDWSPDGNLLVVTSFEGGAYQSRIVDVRNGRISLLPGSKDTLGPWFATQDTLIATADDQSKLVRYDFRTQKWSDILTSPDKFVNWVMSPDGKYFYYSTGGNNPTVFRMRVADDAVEQVVSLKNVRMVNDPDSGPKLNVTPDNSLLVLRDIGTEEVYALSVQWQ